MAEDELDSFTKDAVYADTHREELLREYPEQWVGVYHERVVGAAKTLEELIQQLEEQGIPPGHTFVQYVTEHETMLIVVGVHSLAA